MENKKNFGHLMFDLVIGMGFIFFLPLIFLCGIIAVLIKAIKWGFE